MGASPLEVQDEIGQGQCCCAHHLMQQLQHQQVPCVLCRLCLLGFCASVFCLCVCEVYSVWLYFVECSKMVVVLLRGVLGYVQR